MRRRCHILSRAAAVGAVLILAACTVPDIEQGDYRTLKDADAEIVVNADAFVGTPPARVGYSDFIQREEYALYRSTLAQAELVFLRTRPERRQLTSLDFNELVTDLVQLWRFNQGHPLVFDKSTHVKTPLALFWLQPYRQTDTGRHCVGYAASWDEAREDPFKRPQKVLFGYYCIPKGEQLSMDEAKTFVSSIGIRGITLPRQIKSAYDLQAGDPPSPPKGEQAAALVAAQDGIAGGVSGLPSFPVLAGRIYTPERDNCIAGSC
jgi:hypothetical protein